MGEAHLVECLRCGGFRSIERAREARLDPGTCLRCGYVGWALLADLTESARRGLRELPPERRAARARLRSH